MKRIDRIVEDLKSYFVERRVLEVACGDADFSLAVSKYASSVLGVDISLARVARRSLREMPNNVQFQEMNATHLDLEGGSFDVVVSYNALGHLVGVLKDCVSEIMRTLKKGGYLIFIATWKMDRTLIPNIRSLIAIRRIMPNLQRHRKQGISHVHLEEDIMCERILRIVLHECEWNKGIL